MVLDGIVLRGQAEGVVAHGEQDVIAIHALFAGHHVHGGVGPGVAHVQALAGGIGKLHQRIELGLFTVVGSGKGFSSLHFSCHFFSMFANSYFKLITLSVYSILSHDPPAGNDLKQP